MTWLPGDVAPYFVGLGTLLFAAFGFDLAVAMFRRSIKEMTGPDHD